MKNPFVIALILIIVIFIGIYIGRMQAFKSLFNKPAPAPKEGDACTTGDAKAGTIQGGICTPPKPVDTNAEQRTVLGYSAVSRLGNRIVKCYPKPANASCAKTFYDPRLGMGVFYSQTSTSCCYLF